LLAVLALAPTAVLARQDNASQTKNPEQKSQPAEAQTETDATTQRNTEKAEAPTETVESQKQTEEDSKLTSVPGGKALGMSILGNQEAPKALVIVPWKSSELGSGPSVSTLLDDSRLPIDKEVFMRMLSYYDIRSATARPSGATTNGNAAAPANAAQRRKP
jgi:hypothetical protein